MKEYVVIYDISDVNGGSFFYGVDYNKGTFRTVKQHWNREERHEFITRCRKLMSDEMYYRNVKMFFVDYEALVVKVITKDMLDDMENGL